MRHPIVVPSCCGAAILTALACSEPPRARAPAVPPAAAVEVQPETPTSAIDTAPAPLDTTLGRCGVALRPPSEGQREVIAALRTAYGLEGTLEAHPPLDTISHEEVLAHYRTGFGEDMAQELTNYSWLPANHQLRSTDPALAVPDSVGVVELKGDRALVAWIAPTAFRHQWNAPRCLVDRLVFVDGRWIIQGREP
jgi:hypothetical protein